MEGGSEQASTPVPATAQNWCSENGANRWWPKGSSGCCAGLVECKEGIDWICRGSCQTPTEANNEDAEAKPYIII